MASGRFSQIFLLPEEFVKDAVICKLDWKDLSHLDVAMNHTIQRKNYLRWLYNSIHNLQIGEALDEQFDWISKRGIIVGELLVFGPICEKRLRKFITSNIKVTVKQFDQWRCPLPEKSLTSFIIVLQHLESIVVRTDCSVCDVDSWNRLLKKHQCSLREIDMMTAPTQTPNFFASLIVSIALTLPALVSLILKPCVGVDDSSVQLLAEYCPKLECLDLSGCDALTDLSLRALGQHCRRLSTLHLEANRGTVTDAGVVPLLQGCKKITKLELWDCSHITVSSAVALRPFCNQLTHLALRLCTVFGNKQAALVLRELHHLQAIDLSGCTGLTTQLLLTVMKNNCDLEDITLNALQSVNDSLLAALSQYCPKLRALAVRGCQRVHTISTLSKCRHLRHLDIELCTGVNDAAVLQRAALPGFCMWVYAYGSGITRYAESRLHNSRCIVVQLKPRQEVWE